MRRLKVAAEAVAEVGWNEKVCIALVEEWLKGLGAACVGSGSVLCRRALEESRKLVHVLRTVNFTVLRENWEQLTDRVCSLSSAAGLKYERGCL